MPTFHVDSDGLLSTFNSQRASREFLNVISPFGAHSLQLLADTLITTNRDHLGKTYWQVPVEFLRSANYSEIVVPGG